MNWSRIRERIQAWSFVDPSTDCWVWQGHKDRLGYGRFSYSKHVKGHAYRAAYEAWIGPVPDGLELDHLCRNPACVNPAHLEAVSHKENCLRGVGPIPENAAKTSCKHGHPFDEANTYIRPNGRRDCRTCTAERQRAYQRRKQAA